MPFPLLPNLPKSNIAITACLAFAVAGVSFAIAIYRGRPRPWPVADVPITFWAWHSQSPTEADVRAAIQKAQARRIFLRTGQIDYYEGKLRRIRPLSGAMPGRIELHLVYNATRSLLAQLENIDEMALAAEISRAYQEDIERAAKAHAHVSGLQIDIDFPTRLLPRYRGVLAALRGTLPQGKQLSITGLPTWMDSNKLGEVLAQVDFWVPQLYGAEIPHRLDQTIPISSLASVRHFVNKVRQLDKPFYAGLAAYSWSFQYSRDGRLITLRGDIDPAAIASDPNVELIDRRPFASPTRAADDNPVIESAWRYTFRAKADGITEGLSLRTGDTVVFDLPTAESLRGAARIVRESSGPQLRGICIFRLPLREDRATLTIEQVASALADRDSTVLIQTRIKRDDLPVATSKLSSSTLNIEVNNAGTAGILLGCVEIDLAIPAGSFVGLSSSQAVPFETLCEKSSRSIPATGPRPL